MPRASIDGFNENQVEAESEGEGEYHLGIDVVVSRAILHHRFILTDFVSDRSKFRKSVCTFGYSNLSLSGLFKEELEELSRFNTWGDT